MKATSQMYWSRVILSIISAILCAVLHLGVEGIVLGSSLYLASVFLITLGLKITPQKLNSKTRLYTLGLGTYIFVWLALWILFHTYLVS